jgi:hypothetical protein
MEKEIDLKIELRKLELKSKVLRLKLEKLIKDIGENNIKIIIIENKLKELEENND